MKTSRWFVAALAFGVLWVFVGGAALTPQSLLGTFLVGLVVGIPVAFVFRRLYVEEFDVTRPVTAIPSAVLYGLVFAKNLVVANLDVTYRTLAPHMPLHPQVILIPLRVQTPLGITTIANTISLTPGTVTLDYDPEANALYVHTIDDRDLRDVVAPIRQWEDYALAMFDEERSPGDPAPEITVHPPDYPPEPKRLVRSPDAIQRTEGAGVGYDPDDPSRELVVYERDEAGDRVQYDESDGENANGAEAENADDGGDRDDE